MKTKRGVLLIDNRGFVDKFEEVLEGTPYKLVHTRVQREAMEIIGSNLDYFYAIIFCEYSKEIEKLCLEIRANVSTEDIAIIAAIEDPWSSFLDDLYTLSIDDYIVMSQVKDLIKKLKMISRGLPWPSIKKERGKVLLGERELKKRIFLGRLIRRRGFDLQFADSVEEIESFVKRDPLIELVITPFSLGENKIPDVIRRVRSISGKRLPWIVLGAEEELLELFKLSSQFSPITLFKGFLSPEYIIFLINELLNPPPENVRKSKRVLFRGAVQVKDLNNEEVIWGYLYNINATGVYIRTLTPPKTGSQLELFFRPPFGEGRVKLRGRCVWTKEYGEEKGPVVPHGMGVFFTDISPADSAALSTGYSCLLNATPMDTDFISLTVMK